MSRSKLIRALLAAAALLGALPLMAQAPGAAHAVAAASSPAFPYGTYDSPLPADDNHPTGRTLRVEVTPGWMKVYEDGNLIQTWVMQVDGRNLQFSRLSGACTDPQPIVGRYTWAVDHGALTFAVVSDACPGRGEKMARTRLVPAHSAATAPAAATSVSSAFPFGRYLLAQDSTQGGGNELIIQFNPNEVDVIAGNDTVERHQTTINGDVWQVFELAGECLEPGTYHWTFVNGVLRFQIIADPCEDRARNVSTAKLIRQ